MKICISRLRFVSVIEQRGEKLLGLFSKLGGTAVIYRPKTTYVVPRAFLFMNYIVLRSEYEQDCRNKK